MGRHISIAIRLAFATMLIFGVIYPLGMTALAQLLFHRQADGSMVQEQGRVVGSALIGQSFRGPGYFHPRPSAAGSGYDGVSSGGTNLGPTNRRLVQTVLSRVGAARRENLTTPRGRVPVDMVTASGSGLDPDISPANAYAQASRVADARGMDIAAVNRLIAANTTRRTLGFLGEPRVNVLRINIALDATRRAK